MRGRLLDWALAGMFLAGAFWSKYAAFALAATLGLFLLFDPLARRAWRTPGPYVMALAFAIVIAPNVWWLVGHDFLPFHYVDERARAAAHWYQYLQYPLQWTGEPGAGAAAGGRAARAPLPIRRTAAAAGGRRIGGIQPPLRDSACARAVPGHHGGRRDAGPARDHDVGLSAVVVRAARGAAVAARRPPTSRRLRLVRRRVSRVSSWHGRRSMPRSSSASRSCATGRRRPSSPARSWPTPSPGSWTETYGTPLRLCRAAPSSRSTISRSIRPTTRMSSPTASPRSAPGST